MNRTCESAVAFSCSNAPLLASLSSSSELNRIKAKTEERPKSSGRSFLGSRKIDVQVPKESRQAAAKTGKVGDLSSAPEAELIRLARLRDQEAFRELFLRAHDSCMGLAMSILRDREDASDEMQNALLSAYTHLPSFSGNAKFSSWLARIVINHCKIRIRQRCKSRAVPCEIVGKEGNAYCPHEPQDMQTPERYLGAFEVRRLVSAELQLIPRPFRRALELRFVHGLSPNEVARQLNLSVSATKSRLHRAQKFLRTRMIRHCGLRGVATLTGQA
jgi:RNA polymerase sigma-70 factor (ECF subfamily)